MSVLWSDERVVAIDLHGVGTESLESLYEVLAHLGSFLRMGHRMVLL